MFQGMFCTTLGQDGCFEILLMYSSCFEEWGLAAGQASSVTCRGFLKRVRTIVKPLWRLPPSEAKKLPSGHQIFSNAGNVALKSPKDSVLRDILGDLRATFQTALPQSLLFHANYPRFPCLVVCGSQGLYNRFSLRELRMVEDGDAGCSINLSTNRLRGGHPLSLLLDRFRRAGVHVSTLRRSSVFVNQEWPRQTKKPKKDEFMNFAQGHSGTEVQCESCLFS